MVLLELNDYPVCPTHHALFLLDVRGDEIMQEEESLSVHRDEDVVLELRDETANHLRLLAWQQKHTHL